MTNSDAQFLKRAEPMTWFMAAVGVLIYGAPVICLNFRDGWYPMPLGRLFMTVWGIGVMVAALYFLLMTIKAKRQNP